jgi:hypothetical protein
MISGSEATMGHLDTDRKFHEFRDGPNAQKQAYVEVAEMRDGFVQIVLEEATLKVFGKKWHTTSGCILLTPEQRAALKALL